MKELETSRTPRPDMVVSKDLACIHHLDRICNNNNNKVE